MPALAIVLSLATPSAVIAKSFPLKVYLAVDVSDSVLGASGRGTDPAITQRLNAIFQALGQQHWGVEDEIVPVFFAGEAVFGMHEDGYHEMKPSEVFRRLKSDISKMAATGNNPVSTALGRIRDRLDPCRSNFDLLWKLITDDQMADLQKTRENRRTLTIVISDGEHSKECSASVPTISRVPALDKSKGPPDWVAFLIVHHSSRDWFVAKERDWRAAGRERWEGARFWYQDVSSMPTDAAGRLIVDLLSTVRDWYVPRIVSDDTRALDVTRRMVVEVPLDLILEERDPKQPYTVSISEVEFVPAHGRSGSVRVEQVGDWTYTLHRAKERIYLKGFVDLPAGSPDADDGEYDLRYRFTIRIAERVLEQRPGVGEIRTTWTTFSVDYYPSVVWQLLPSDLREFVASTPLQRFLGQESRDIVVTFRDVCRQCWIRWTFVQPRKGDVLDIRGGDIHGDVKAYRWAPVRFSGDGSLRFRLVIPPLQRSAIVGTDLRWHSEPPRGFRDARHRGHGEPRKEDTVVRLAVLVGLPAVMHSVGWLFATIAAFNAAVQFVVKGPLSGWVARIPASFRAIIGKYGGPYCDIFGIARDGGRFFIAGMTLLFCSLLLHVTSLIWAFPRQWTEFLNPFHLAVLVVFISYLLFGYKFERSREGLIGGGVWMPIEFVVSSSHAVAVASHLLTGIWIHPANDAPFITAFAVMLLIGAGLPLLAHLALAQVRKHVFNTEVSSAPDRS